MSRTRKPKPARVRDVCAAMECIAPTWLAADWDNVGLLVGSEDWPAKRILLTIDLTPEVATEAIEKKTDVVIAYHPPIFRAVKQMRPDLSQQDGIAAEMLARRIAVYSPHTAIDAAEEGTNVTLARLAGIASARPFNSAVNPSRNCKLVTFVPADAAERVSDAIFAAGAGRIGDYSKCSFCLDGSGTFFGADSTNPAVGEKGRLERVAEIRIETIVPMRRLSDVTVALRRAHPYEEPAFDLYPLTGEPLASLGQGRVGAFDKPVRLGELARQLAKRVGAKAPAIVGKPSAIVRRGFVCVGAAGSLPFEASTGPCGPGDVVITGEIRHHDALRYERSGAGAIALGHSTSERPILKPLGMLLKKHLAGATIDISRKDRDPLQAIESAP
ncbi:MAG: Nif3-like dinuclear metal center hexameric protein [Phycisphaerales bacterium]|nr:Nif3-like dinuclear metal center hexameric protein [Phycisphaerales bacterium]MCB9854319.1 Nif3-like dinuclear metal center hexameric protein [Phycisphaerales bacterium]MCB9863520.1 Nif3-like dinuclear metal center hexameric protein [Phycisphaerales bacterium]